MIAPAWKLTKTIFRQPLLVSILVGVGIHGLLALNSYAFQAPGYMQALEHDVLEQPVYGLVHVLVPFLVPLLISSVARRIREETEIVSLKRFPEANPNLIFKLDRRGKALYVNQAVRDFLRETGRSPEEVTALLPDDTGTLVTRLIGTNQTERREKVWEDRILQYQFRAFPEEDSVFITGMDITPLRRAEHQLQDINTHLLSLSNRMDESLHTFNSLQFDLFDYYRTLLQDILRNPDSRHYDQPVYVLLGLLQEDQSFRGTLFFKHGNEVVVEKNRFRIQPSAGSPRAIQLGQEQVFWANQETSGLSEEDFQRIFHPDVQARIGPIRHFATYTSTDVALIAVYDHHTVDALDAQLLKNLTVYVQSLKLLSDQVRETEDAFLYTIKALARAAEANDEDTGNHILRVNEYARLLAETLGLDPAFCHTIHYSAQMHDVGKIHVHPDILRKPGPLTPTEIQLMKLHTETGARILGDEPRLQMAREIAYAHHEKFDGSGYPRKLSGDAIPLAARIVAVGDVYDALRQKRVYKPSLSHEEAHAILTRGDGRVDPGHFDPEVLRAFQSVHTRFDDIYEQMKDQ